MSSQQRYKRERWVLYFALLLFRIFGVFQRGYIHPDEFYQGGSELFFGRQWHDDVFRHDRLNDDWTDGDGGGYIANNVPWEFEPIHAVRSIVPPAFMTLLPLRVYVTLRASISRLFPGVGSASSKSGGYGVTRKKSCTVASILWVPSMEDLSGREILLVPRLFVAFLSILFLDGSLWMLLSHHRLRRRKESIPTFKSIARDAYDCGPPIEVISLASSWPCLVFGIRPFTNSLEAMMLAFLLVIVTVNASCNAKGACASSRPRGEMNGDKLSLLLIGATCSVGIFVRFTFAFFALPVLLLFLWYRREKMGRELKCIFHDGLWMSFSFLLISFAFILVDTKYYSCQAKLTCDNSTCVERSKLILGDILKYIAPFNAFRYNSKSSNLAEHGLHPRMTHSVVNMPMLFGPLALVGYGSVIQNMYNLFAGTNKKRCDDSSYLFTKAACQWAILSGLLVLSCAPHQEPRFLLPTTVPLVFLYGRKVLGVSGMDSGTSSVPTQGKEQSKVALCLLVTWTGFNLILYMFFGWMHQGGLLPSLLHLADTGNSLRRNDPIPQSPEALVYYKTYMPPTFLTRGRPYATREEGTCEEEGMCSNHLQHHTEVILDLKGADLSVLLEVLRKWLPCSGSVNDSDIGVGKLSGSINDRFLRLVSPPAVILPLTELSATINWEYSINLARDHHGHISTEDWPAYDGSVKRFLDNLKLDVYTISCIQ